MIAECLVVVVVVVFVVNVVVDFDAISIHSPPLSAN